MNTPGWDAYCKTGAKPFLEFSKLVHGCSPDLVTRSVTVTAIMTAVWQHMGLSVPRCAPSQILVYAGSLDIDPIDRIVGNCSGRLKVGSLDRCVMKEDIREWMKFLLSCRNQGSKDSQGVLSVRAAGACEAFCVERTRIFGCGQVGAYAERMDVDIGCVTNGYDEAVLHFDRKEDYDRFREDVFDRGRDLLNPIGYDDKLNVVRKTIYINGSIRPSDWDEALTAGIINAGLPVLFLPHSAAVDFKLPKGSWSNLGRIAYMLATEGLKGYPIPDSRQRSSYPDDKGFNQCMDSLRQRLRFFPADYEYIILSLVREVRLVCLLFAIYLAQDGTPAKRIEPLARDLHLMCVVGITYGIRCLGYHAFGMDVGGSRSIILRLLAVVRETGVVSRREILRRCQSIDALKRDRILDLLAGQGIVRFDGRDVIAVSLEDFVRRVARSSEFVGMRLLSFDEE